MITAIGDVMRECYSRGWITTRDGNCSLRKTGESKIYITPSGVRKNIIYPETIQKIDIINGELNLNKEGMSPSGELDMHWRILKNANYTRCVLHVHATNIVAAMFAGWDLNSLSAHFPEVFRYTRVGHNVPKLPAISEDLAIATEREIAVRHDGVCKFDVVGQANHGVCSVGKNPWDAFEHIERLEHICQIVLNSGVNPHRN